MVVRLVLWNLADSLTNIGELRALPPRRVGRAFERVPGLLFKSWISDEITDRWGAIYVWESRRRRSRSCPSRARELIGKDPDIAEVFDLEATVSVAPELTHLGLAFEA